MIPSRLARKKLKDIKAFLFDLDGSITFGRDLAPGAQECIEWVSRSGKGFGFITNNSHQSPRQIERFLKARGIEASEDRIFLPTRAAGAFIAERFGQSRVFVVGSPRLAAFCAAYGHSVVPIHEGSCDVVLVGLDFRFSYRKLKAAAEMLHRGAALVCTNPDISHPGEGELPVPEAGSLLACMRGFSREPPLLVGKPELWLFKAAAERFGLRFEDMAIVGDNPETDIAGGRASGLFTVFLHGDHRAAGSVSADLSCADIGHFLYLLRDTKEVHHEG